MSKKTLPAVEAWLPKIFVGDTIRGRKLYKFMVLRDGYPEDISDIERHLCVPVADVARAAAEVNRKGSALYLFNKQLREGK